MKEQNSHPPQSVRGIMRPPKNGPVRDPDPRDPLLHRSDHVCPHSACAGTGGDKPNILLHSTNIQTRPTPLRGDCQTANCEWIDFYGRAQSCPNGGMIMFHRQDNIAIFDGVSSPIQEFCSLLVTTAVQWYDKQKGYIDSFL